MTGTGSSETEAGGFDEQAGATGLLIAKRLLVVARRVVGPMTVARLSRLFTGSTHVVKHPVAFVRVLVRVRSLGTRLRRLIKLHADVVVLVELDGDTVNVPGGFCPFPFRNC